MTTAVYAGVVGLWVLATGVWALVVVSAVLGPEAIDALRAATEAVEGVSV